MNLLKFMLSMWLNQFIRVAFMGVQDTTTSGFDAALKNVYLPDIIDQINQKTRLLDIFTEEDPNEYQFEGRQAIVALHTSRNSGVKAAGEGGLMPVAGKQGYANLTIPMKYAYGRIELTAQVMKQSKSDKGSFARAMESEQSGLVKDVSRQRNRYLAGFGQGTLAQISSGTASATQSLKAPGGVAGTVNVARFIPPGTMVAVTSSDGNTLRGVQTVNSVTEPNMVLDGSITTTTGDLVSLGSNAVAPGESSFNLEPMGILGIIDSTTFVSSIFGLDRSLAANAFFRSNIFSSVGTLSPDLLYRAIDNTEEVSGELITDWLGHYSIRREVLKLSEADRRYAGGTSAIAPDAGSTAAKKDPTFSDLPLRVDRDLPYGTLFGLSKSNLNWLPLVKGEWADDDGSVLGRVKDKDNYEARFRVFENYFSKKGNAFVRLDGINATVTQGAYLS